LLCREAAPLKIERACYFMPVNEGPIEVTPLGASLDTAGEVFDLHKVHPGNRLLKTPEMPPDADLDLCASATPDGRRIYVTAVNRSIGNDRTVELELQNFAGPVASAVKFLVPHTLDANARGFRQLNEEPGVLDDKRVVVKIPPCAIARLRFGRPGPLE
jgi:hypothetical protein